MELEKICQYMEKESYLLMGVADEESEVPCKNSEKKLLEKMYGI